jgi:hypothetical protein
MASSPAVLVKPRNCCEGVNDAFNAFFSASSTVTVTIPQGLTDAEAVALLAAFQQIRQDIELALFNVAEIILRLACENPCCSAAILAIASIYLGVLRQLANSFSLSNVEGTGPLYSLSALQLSAEQLIERANVQVTAILQIVKSSIPREEKEKEKKKDD